MQYFVIIAYYLITIPLYFPLIVSSLENIEKTNEIFYFFLYDQRNFIYAFIRKIFE